MRGPQGRQAQAAGHDHHVAALGLVHGPGRSEGAAHAHLLPGSRAAEGRVVTAPTARMVWADELGLRPGRR